MRSLRIARVAGIDIRLHPTFILIVLYGAWEWGALGLKGAIFGAVFMLCVFASVTLHELGHAFMAKAFRIPVKNITLTPLGGIAQMQITVAPPMQEGLIAIAGPTVNFVLAFGIAVLSVTHYGTEALREALLKVRVEEPSAMTLWVLLIAANLMMGLFNLLPAFPMDGGRILRALLSAATDSERATRWAVTVGRVFAVGFMVFGFINGTLMLSVIGFFIFMAGGAELSANVTETVLKRITAREAIDAFAPRFLPNTARSEALRAVLYTPFPVFAVEHFGRLLGVVTRGQLIAAEQRNDPDEYVTALMRRDVPSIAASATLAEVRATMVKEAIAFVAVADGETFLGLITEQDIGQQATRYARSAASKGREPISSGSWP